MTSLHRNLVPTFAKVQGQLVNNKGKTRAKELISKVNLVEHKRNIHTDHIKESQKFCRAVKT